MDTADFKLLILKEMNNMSFILRTGKSIFTPYIQTLFIENRTLQWTYIALIFQHPKKWRVGEVVGFEQSRWGLELEACKVLTKFLSAFKLLLKLIEHRISVERKLIEYLDNSL